MNNKDRKWLLLCDGQAGMYPGIQQDVVPRSTASRLVHEGLIRAYMPHNGVHKDRWVITDAGRSALAQQELS
jgi:hypothetical protein